MGRRSSEWSGARRGAARGGRIAVAAAIRRHHRGPGGDAVQEAAVPWPAGGSAALGRHDAQYVRRVPVRPHQDLRHGRRLLPGRAERAAGQHGHPEAGRRELPRRRDAAQGPTYVPGRSDAGRDRGGGHVRRSLRVGAGGARGRAADEGRGAGDVGRAGDVLGRRLRDDGQGGERAGLVAAVVLVPAVRHADARAGRRHDVDGLLQEAGLRLRGAVPLERGGALRGDLQGRGAGGDRAVQAAIGRADHVLRAAGRAPGAAAAGLDRDVARVQRCARLRVPHPHGERGREPAHGADGVRAVHDDERAVA
mmetsp:Transcript_15492/g.53816  ORF Transcript_15492/g.53816 Transcript_15492/m.53816 type:complete len:308 (+) Transcript_15492:229-1152(+)